MPKTISAETRAAILEAAWRLIAEKGQADVGQAEIAAAAGVSRQTLFLAFGSRTGLLTAMARHKDSTSPTLARLMEVATERRSDREQLPDVVAAWIDYIPEIFPVASLLDSAGMTDPEARTAIDDRLVGALLKPLVSRVRRMAAAGLIVDDMTPERVAQSIWEFTHIRAWRSLVVDCGWTPEEFKRSRLDLVRRYLR